MRGFHYTLLVLSREASWVCVIELKRAKDVEVRRTRGGATARDVLWCGGFERRIVRDRRERVGHVGGVCAHGFGSAHIHYSGCKNVYCVSW